MKSFICLNVVDEAYKRRIANKNKKLAIKTRICALTRLSTLSILVRPLNRTLSRCSAWRWIEIFKTNIVGSEQHDAHSKMATGSSFQFSTYNMTRTFQIFANKRKFPKRKKSTNGRGSHSGHFCQNCWEIKEPPSLQCKQRSSPWQSSLSITSHPTNQPSKQTQQNLAYFAKPCPMWRRRGCQNSFERCLICQTWRSRGG